MPKQELKEFESNRRFKVETCSTNRVSLFDIDGTSTEGFTITSLAQFLAERDMFKPSSWVVMKDSIVKYGNSNMRRDDYETFAVELVDACVQGLKGQSVANVVEKSSSFLENALRGEIEGYRIHKFAGELVSTANLHGRTIAISGSPYHFLLPLSKYLGFDGLYATLFKEEDGCFTGGVIQNCALDTVKEKIVLGHEFDRKMSCAFGDSAHDLPLLEAVDNPFVLGDNKAFQEIASRRGWPVHVNGDGIILGAQSVLKNYDVYEN